MLSIHGETINLYRLWRTRATLSDEPNKIVYSMIRVSKYCDRKPVLKDISLSCFYGAKIGVLGLNGSGKSTLLRILAGVEPDFHGETHLAPGKSVGLVEQEPDLDDAKTVREVVEEGAGEAARLLAERAGAGIREAFMALLRASEVLERLPTRYVTGCYVALKAVKE